MSYGKSLSQTQNAFLQPPSHNRPDERDPPGTEVRANRRREANVFDAVAGRVTASGMLSQPRFSSRYRHNVSSSRLAVRPEEVLFRRLNAPIRYEEDDFYFANEKLPSNCTLPSSEMLQAIHAYTADFYSSPVVAQDGGSGGVDDFGSMDETALIAMGVLMEEMSKEALGETGDLVLVEGEPVGDDYQQLSQSDASVGKVRKKRSKTKAGSFHASEGEGLWSIRKKKKKKKKKKKRARRAESAATAE